ncbi:MAG TPA: thaumatin family protein [Candidatus Binataceae bacterium]|nr:thaumatin family protein [Candidatus Binataceae bacterium]
MSRMIALWTPSLDRETSWFRRWPKLIAAVALLVVANLILLAPAGADRLAIPDATPTPGHRVVFTNDCTQPIWLAETNGSSDLSPPFAPGWDLGLAQKCSKSVPCPDPASKCVEGACTCTNKGGADSACGDGNSGFGFCRSNGRCATSVTMNLPVNFPSGRFWGRTGCTGSGSSLTCDTGNCGDNLADCYGNSANNATLWEQTLSPLSATDFYDVSLASGYNVSLKVVSGKTSCLNVGCLKDLSAKCPTDLQYPGSGSIEACTQPGLFCLANPLDPICTAENENFYNCTNADQVDQLGEAVNLESPNAGTPICFDASDCPAKSVGVPFNTKCDLNPTFDSNPPSWPSSGAGICIGKQGVTQNGGCAPVTDDGKPCSGGPSFVFPYPNYTCATVLNPLNHNAEVGVCLPPGIATPVSTPAAYGSLIWNADNFTPAGTQPVSGCALDSDCSTGQYCLATTVNKFPASGAPQAQSVAQCTADSASPSNGCECYAVQNCTSSSQCTGGTQCLNESGPCPNSNGQACVCETSSVLTGVCGPPNANWQEAMAAVPLATPTPTQPGNYLNVFRNACPRAYSFQFDDQAGLAQCQNTKKLTDYAVTFCGELKPGKP